MCRNAGGRLSRSCWKMNFDELSLPELLDLMKAVAEKIQERAMELAK